MSHRQEGIVSGLSPDFRGQNVEAAPYPNATGFRHSAPTLTRFTGKPLRAFPWLSYSPPSVLPKVVEGVSPDSACRQVGSSPRRSRLNDLKKTEPPERDYATNCRLTRFDCQGALEAPNESPHPL